MDYLHFGLLMSLAFVGGVAVGYLAGRGRLSHLLFLAIPCLLLGLIVGYLASSSSHLFRVVGGILGALFILILLALTVLALVLAVIAFMALKRLLS